MLRTRRRARGVQREVVAGGTQRGGGVGHCLGCWRRRDKRVVLFNLKQTDVTTRLRGNAAEDAALAHLLAEGLTLVERNYRTPGRGGGEIDLVMREAGGTLVFVEVRARAGTTHGGAAASVGGVK
ncbi:MAG: hypothetical protein E6Q64_05830, partial [Ottowia sp.]